MLQNNVSKSQYFYPQYARMLHQTQIFALYQDIFALSDFTYLYYLHNVGRISKLLRLLQYPYPLLRKASDALVPWCQFISTHTVERSFHQTEPTEKFLIL